MDYINDAIAMANEEMKDKKIDSSEKIIGQYLVSRFAVDVTLSKAYIEKKRTISDTWEFIIEEARKRLDGKSGAVADSEVFQWAVHYVLDGPEHEQEESEKPKEQKELNEKQPLGTQISLFDMVAQEANK